MSNRDLPDEFFQNAASRADDPGYLLRELKGIFNSRRGNYVYPHDAPDDQGPGIDITNAQPKHNPGLLQAYIEFVTGLLSRNYDSGFGSDHGTHDNIAPSVDDASRVHWGRGDGGRREENIINRRF